MAMRFLHDPSAFLDYVWDWSGWLEAGETIDSYTVTPPAEITLGPHSQAAGVVTAWLSGGIAKKKLRVVCRIVTNLGRRDGRTITLRVDDR